MGFANLALGVLAAIAVGRRDGFRAATVIGGAILSVGAFTVHMFDIVQHGNLAPGNTLININNLGRPALMIFLLWSLHRIEISQESEGMSQISALWQEPQAVLGGIVGAGVGIGLGIGMAVNQPLLGLVCGLVGGSALGWVMSRRTKQAQRAPVLAQSDRGPARAFEQKSTVLNARAEELVTELQVPVFKS
jgi:hypothetical protein